MASRAEWSISDFGINGDAMARNEGKQPCDGGLARALRETASLRSCGYLRKAASRNLNGRLSKGDPRLAAEGQKIDFSIH